MPATPKDTRITITIPADLRKVLKIRAIQNDRSFSGEIVHCLKVGSGWQETQTNDDDAHLFDL